MSGERLLTGHMALLTVSDSDLNKGGSTTAEIVLYILTRLARMGVPIHDYEVTLQLDNTSSSNKNNCMLHLAGLLTKRKAVRLMRLTFLRVGHTHEDIDQWFGELIRRSERQRSVSSQSMCSSHAYSCVGVTRTVCK